MSNKIQMFCNTHNTYNKELIEETWLRIKRDYKRLNEMKKEKRSLIVDISSLDENQMLRSDYLFLRLKYSSVMIQAINDSIKENLESLRIFSDRLVIC